MTGGDAEIQEINPYYGDPSRSGSAFEVSVDRESKAVVVQPQKSLVDVFIRYQANSVVDMNAVTSKLVSNTSGAIVTNSNGDTSSVSNTQVDTTKSSSVVRRYQTFKYHWNFLCF